MIATEKDHKSESEKGVRKIHVGVLEEERAAILLEVRCLKSVSKFDDIDREEVKREMCYSCLRYQVFCYFHFDPNERRYAIHRVG